MKLRHTEPHQLEDGEEFNEGGWANLVLAFIVGLIVALILTVMVF